MTNIKANKPLIFVGDIHGNAQALTQILNMYPQDYYFVVWSGDFINSKVPVSDKEIEYILYMMLANCKNVLYSNHMHLMYRYLNRDHKYERKIAQSIHFDEDQEWSRLKWSQSKRVLDNLSDITKQQLIKHCRDSYFCIRYHNSLMAHAYPCRELINSTFSNTLLDKKRKMSVGIGKASQQFWNSPDEEMNSLLQEFAYLVVGHHGLITRHDNIRVIDLKGIQVPVWESETDNIKIFPY